MRKVAPRVSGGQDTQLISQINKAKRLMKPLVAENFESLDGACGYFNLLEKDNERMNEKAVVAAASANKPQANESSSSSSDLHSLPKGYP